MPVEIIYYGSGPCPVRATFNAPANTPAAFVLSGTTRTQNAACMTGLTLKLDGAQIGNPALCWANQNNNHTAMMPIFIPVTLTFGEHQIEIDNANGDTITDQNDLVQLVLIY